MLLEPGPVDHLVPAELLAPIPEGTLTGFVAGGLADLGGVDAALGAAQSTIGDALANGPGAGFGAEIDEAAVAHASHAGAPPVSVSGEVAVAQAEADALAGMAGGLPPDGAPLDPPQASQPSDVFDDAGEASGATSGGSGGGHTGGSGSSAPGDAIDPNASALVNLYRGRLDAWTRAHFGRPAQGGELGDVNRVYDVHGTIDDALFDQLIQENFIPRL